MKKQVKNLLSSVIYKRKMLKEKEIKEKKQEEINAELEKLAL